MALIPGDHERLLSEFKDEVCQNPEADFDLRITEVADKFREQENKRFSVAFFLLLLELYEGDIHSLNRDLLKIRLLATAKAPSQRTELLRCVYRVMSLYVQDFAGLIAICEDAEAAYSRIKNGSPEPEG